MTLLEAKDIVAKDEYNCTWLQMLGYFKNTAKTNEMVNRAMLVYAQSKWDESYDATWEILNETLDPESDNSIIQCAARKPAFKA